jgi:predicted AAA+ superfamily ATPase
MLAFCMIGQCCAGVQDRAGGEVDFVLEAADGRVAAVEVKAGQTPKREWFRWLAHMRDTLGEAFTVGVVLYGGQHTLPFGERLLAVPISALWECQVG